MVIENRINQLRGELPFWKLAQKAGIPESTLKRVSISKGPGPQMATAFRIARALGVEVGDVFVAANEEI